MSAITRRNLSCLITGALLLAGSTGCTSHKHQIEHEVRQVLDRQTTAWNNGSLDGFMETYWNSPDLTFASGGQVLRGWHPTMDRYRRRYPDTTAMGKLSTEDVRVTEIAPAAALVVGKWHLHRTRPIGGTFSLVMRKKQNRWVIIHDHTTLDE